MFLFDQKSKVQKFRSRQNTCRVSVQRTTCFDKRRHYYSGRRNEIKLKIENFLVKIKKHHFALN